MRLRLEKGFVKLGAVLGSEAALGAVPLALGRLRNADALEVKPLVRTVVGVAADHLRHLVVGTAAVAVEPLRVLERVRRRRLGAAHRVRPASTTRRSVRAPNPRAAIRIENRQQKLHARCFGRCSDGGATLLERVVVVGELQLGRRPKRRRRRRRAGRVFRRFPSLLLRRRAGRVGGARLRWITVVPVTSKT